MAAKTKKGTWKRISIQTRERNQTAASDICEHPWVSRVDRSSFTQMADLYHRILRLVDVVFTHLNGPVGKVLSRENCRHHVVHEYEVDGRWQLRCLPTCPSTKSETGMWRTKKKSDNASKATTTNIASDKRKERSTMMRRLTYGDRRVAKRSCRKMDN